MSKLRARRNRLESIHGGTVPSGVAACAKEVNPGQKRTEHVPPAPAGSEACHRGCPDYTTAMRKFSLE